MDTDTILRMKPALTEYLHVFDGCFGRITARRHLDTYVEGQLSEQPGKGAVHHPVMAILNGKPVVAWTEHAPGSDRLRRLFIKALK